MSRKGCPNKISKKILFICRWCKKEWMDYPSRIARKRFCSHHCAAISRKDVLFRKGNKINVGKKYSKRHRENIAKSLRGKKSIAGSIAKKGNKNPNWRGGTTPERK